MFVARSLAHRAQQPAVTSDDGYRGRLYRLLIIPMLMPLLLVTCGSVLQGPVFGSITLKRQSDAKDAVAFLRCRGGGFHGEIQTDAENVRVAADGGFTFAGSLTFPTTERCYIEIRHPRYLAARVDLEDKLVQTLAPITPQAWDEFLDAGPAYDLNPATHRPWPDSEVRRHLVDTRMWLNTFSVSERHRMAGYMPGIHSIYARANAVLIGHNVNPKEKIRTISKLEEMTAYPYPYVEYLQAVERGEAAQVEVFLSGGVLRRGQVSMLYLAATKGHLEVMDVLLAHDEPIGDVGCYTPLLGAISKRQWPAVVKLLHAGASIETDCQSNQLRVGDAFGNFARRGQLDLLEQFLDAGVPVDLRNQRKTTALAEAVTAGRIEAVKFLLAAGANPDERTADDTPLVAQAERMGLLDVERELKLALVGVAPAAQTAAAQSGTAIPLSWRLGEPQPYRVHTSFGQILDMAADPQRPGVLWLATLGGLLRVAPESGEQRSWTMADGLQASTVYSLWFDSAGKYLWLSTSGGLARLPLDDLERIETISGKDLRVSVGSGFLPGASAGQLWYWSDGGLYRLAVENSTARHYPLPETVFGAAAIAGSSDFFISDNTTLWRLDPSSGERSKVLDSEVLGELTGDGPPGLPQLRQLTVDARGGYLWIDSFRHGVFRRDLASGSLERPLLNAEQLAQCARTTVTPHMHGQVTLAAGMTFVQLERCFGSIGLDNSFIRLRPAIDAGPIADAKGDIWLVTDSTFYRMDTAGEESAFPRSGDPLDNAQVSAIEQVGAELHVRSYRSPVAVLDLKKRSWSRSSIVAQPEIKLAASRRHETVDPGHAGLTWSIRSSGVLLADKGRVIQRWPAHLPSGAITVTRDEVGTTVWIANNGGLIEFPVAGSPSEWLAR